MTWFSWDTEDGGIAFHETEAAAKAAAEASLAAERDLAGEGWSENVEDICWGKVLGRVVETDRRPAGPEAGYDETVDYALRDVEPVVYVVEQKPRTAAESEIARQIIEEEAMTVAVEWNRRHPVGTPVRYWTGMRKGDGVASRTRYVASVMGGHTPVVWVDGHPACIALSHVEPLSEGSPAAQVRADEDRPIPFVAKEEKP